MMVDIVSGLHIYLRPLGSRGLKVGNLWRMLLYAAPGYTILASFHLHMTLCVSLDSHALWEFDLKSILGESGSLFSQDCSFTE